MEQQATAMATNRASVRKLARPALALLLAVSFSAIPLTATPAKASAANLLPNEGKVVSHVDGKEGYGFSDNGSPGSVMKKCVLKGDTLTVRAIFTKPNGHREKKLTTRKFKLAKKVKLYHSEGLTLFCHGSFKRATAVKYVKRWCRALGATAYMKNGKVVAFKGWN